LTRPRHHSVTRVSKPALAAVARDPSPGRAQLIGTSDRPSAQTDERSRVASERPELGRVPAPDALQRPTDEAQHRLGPARPVGVAHRGRDARGGADVHDPQAAGVTLAGLHRATRGSLTCAKQGLDRVPPDRGRWQRESSSGSSECSHSSDATTTGCSSAWRADSDAALTCGPAKLLEPSGHTTALGQSSASQWGLSFTKSSAVSSARLP
jgi:hypothetical protein